MYNNIFYNLIVCSLLTKLIYSLINFTLNNYIDGFKGFIFIGLDLIILNKLEKYK